MKHRKTGKKLNRDTQERKALFRSLLKSLIIYEEIKTTVTKAKIVKRLIDRLVVKAKIGNLSNQRQLQAFIPDKQVVDKLIKKIAPRFNKRTSGFSRITLLGKRRGDNTQLAKIEFVKKQVAQEQKDNKGKKRVPIQKDKETQETKKGKK